MLITINQLEMDFGASTFVLIMLAPSLGLKSRYNGSLNTAAFDAVVVVVVILS